MDLEKRLEELERRLKELERRDLPTPSPRREFSNLWPILLPEVTPPARYRTVLCSTASIGCTGYGAVDWLPSEIHSI